MRFGASNRTERKAQNSYFLTISAFGGLLGVGENRFRYRHTAFNHEWCDRVMNGSRELAHAVAVVLGGLSMRGSFRWYGFAHAVKGFIAGVTP